MSHVGAGLHEITFLHPLLSLSSGNDTGGMTKVQQLGVVSPPREGDVVSASSLGIVGMPDAKVLIPPAVTHEIGADAIAMMLMTGILERDDPCIVVDYGTNAEMALVIDGNVYTGSAASGPALEGQQIKRGMLAAPGAICEVEVTDRGWRCHVLDGTMAAQPGDVIDPLTGNVVEEGPMHGKAVGITGTGVIAALSCGLKTGLVVPPRIGSESGLLHLQDGITIESKDVEEAGKAIGALRAGFLTLLDFAGVWVDDVRTAYMSGASGLYVDARKALEVGMVTPGARHIVQFGNTSIGLARRMVLGETSLEELRDFAKRLKATHCMFATSEFFKNLYGIEYSVWGSGMPMSEYNQMCGIYGISPLPELPDPSEVEVRRLTVRDLPDTEACQVRIVNSGTVLTGIVEGCIGCQRCVGECPEKALTIVRDGDVSTGHIESDRCAGTACRRCEKVGPGKVLHTLEFRMG